MTCRSRLFNLQNDFMHVIQLACKSFLKKFFLFLSPQNVMERESPTLNHRYKDFFLNFFFVCFITVIIIRQDLVHMTQFCDAVYRMGRWGNEMSLLRGPWIYNLRRLWRKSRGLVMKFSNFCPSVHNYIFNACNIIFWTIGLSYPMIHDIKIDSNDDI